MKHIADVLTAGINKHNETPPQAEDSYISDQAIELVNNLFVLFNTHVTFFKLNQSSNQSEYLVNKREWVKTFIERRVSLEQVQIGAAKIRRLEEPLKNITPADFMKLCRTSPEELGLPHVNEAYNEAIANYGREKDNPKWTHPVVRHAAYYSKSYELMNLPRDKSFALFEHNYQQSIKLYINGELGDFKLALPSNEEQAAKKDDGVVLEQYKEIKGASAALAAIRGLL